MEYNKIENISNLSKEEMKDINGGIGINYVNALKSIAKSVIDTLRSIGRAWT